VNEPASSDNSSRAALERVKRLLHDEWNPIGAPNLPADEYDSYSAA
jgi:hypothetical protein